MKRVIILCFVLWIALMVVQCDRIANRSGCNDPDVKQSVLNILILKGDTVPSHSEHCDIVMKANGDGCFYRCSHPEPNRWAYNGRMFLRLISTINGDKYHCDCSAYVVDVKEHKTDFQPLSRSGREAKIAYDVKLDETNGKYFVETTVPSYSDWTGLSADEAEDVPIDFPEAEGTARGQGG